MARVRLLRRSFDAFGEAGERAGELGLREPAALDLIAEAVDLALERGRSRQCDAEGSVDLMRDAGNELAEGSELFRLDEVRLRLPKLGERRVGTVLGLAQGVLAATDLPHEEVHRACHGAELVLPRRLRDRPGSRIGRKLDHSLLKATQRLGDRARDDEGRAGSEEEADGGPEHQDGAHQPGRSGRRRW